MKNYKKLSAVFLAAVLICAMGAVNAFAAITPDGGDSFITGDEPVYDEPTYEEPSYEETPSQPEETPSVPENTESSDSAAQESSTLAPTEAPSQTSSAESSAEYSGESSADDSNAATVTEETTGESAEEEVSIVMDTTVPEIGTDDTTATGADVTEPEAESEGNYQVFGQLPTKTNAVANELNQLAMILIITGSVGLLAIIIWSIASRDRHPEETDVYAAVANAQKNEPANPYDYNDNYSYVRSGDKTAQTPVKQAPAKPAPQQRPAQARVQQPAARTSTPPQQTTAAAVAQRRPTQAAAKPTAPKTTPCSEQRPTSYPTPEQVRSNRTRDQAKAKMDLNTDALLNEILGKNK